MKRFLTKMGSYAFLIAMLLICRASGCNPDPDDPTLTVNKYSITLKANGDGDKDISVSATETDWTATVTEGSSWLRVNKNGQLATISVDTNTTTKPRTGKIKITATANTNLSSDITVTQEAGKSSITVDKSSLEFQTEGGSQTIQITSNTTWKVSGLQSWLTVSPAEVITEPTNSSEVKVVTIVASESEDKRDCTLIFTTSNGEASVSVTISQKGPSESGVYAKPTDELLMCTSYSWRVSCGRNTKYFYQNIYSYSDYKKMSEREIIKNVVTGKVSDRNIPNDDNYWSHSSLYENTSYVLAIVPYGENDKQGKLYIQEFKTKNSDSEPQGKISGFYIDWLTNSYFWNVTKNTYCASYYMYAVAGQTVFPTLYWMAKEDYGLIAWAIRNELEKDNSNHLAYVNRDIWKSWGNNEFIGVEKMYAPQVNDGTSSLTANPLSDLYMQIIVWGTKSNGDLSGFMNITYGDWSGDESRNSYSRKMAPVEQNMKTVKNNDSKIVRGNINDFKVMRIK